MRIPKSGKETNKVFRGIRITISVYKHESISGYKKESFYKGITISFQIHFKFHNTTKKIDKIYLTCKFFTNFKGKILYIKNITKSFSEVLFALKAR